MNVQVEKVVFASDLVKIGMQRCSSEDPFFSRPQPTENYAFVFPRSASLVRRDSGAQFVADPTVVNLWNRNESYSRDALSPAGALADWFAVAHGAVFDAVHSVDPGIEDQPDRPFRFTHVPANSELYLSQRRILSRALAGDAGDPIGVEEAVLELLTAAVSASYRHWGRPTSSDREPKRAHQEEVVGRAEAVVARSFRDPLSIGAIAREIGCSPYYLCRLFKLHRKSTLHAHRNQLRLRVALETVLDTNLELTELSFDLGYSSHSHFTWAFRREYGLTPSALRKERCRLSSIRLPANVRPRHASNIKAIS